MCVNNNNAVALTITQSTQVLSTATTVGEGAIRSLMGL